MKSGILLIILLILFVLLIGCAPESKSTEDELLIEAEIVTQQEGISLEEARNIVGNAAGSITWLECSDSDGGLNSFNKEVYGELTLKYDDYYGKIRTATVKDKCYDSTTKKIGVTGDKVFERACRQDNNGLRPVFQHMNCNRGCENGICNTDIDISCNIRDFSMAFIFVVNDRSERTIQRISKLNSIKTAFANEFNAATLGLSSMDTSYPLFTILREDVTEYSLASISRKFYETNPDIFDFISIYALDGSGTQLQTSHQSAQNHINGIGLGIHDITSEFGSNGRLLGVNYFRDLDPMIGTDALLHETGHQWCCYVGDSFYGDANIPNDNTPLGLLDEHLIHFTGGLDSPYKCATPLISSPGYWIANGDGTYSVSKECLETAPRYHPFQLYFMGLYNSNNFDFNKNFAIYHGEFDTDKSVPYRQVNINDIISVEGERNCQELGGSPVLPTIG